METGFCVSDQPEVACCYTALAHSGPFVTREQER
jgi:hypothetical protein